MSHNASIADSLPQLPTLPTFSLREDLKGISLPVLQHGYVKLVDFMGSDNAIANAARNSYTDVKNRSDDETLLRYMVRNKHSSPIEFGVIVVEAALPIFVERQWIRHRMASTSEVSGRYSVLPDQMEQFGEHAWRTQSTTNKQGSEGPLPEEWPEHFSYEEEFNTVTRWQPPKPIDEAMEAVGENPPPAVKDWSVFTREDISTPGKFLKFEETEIQHTLRKAYERRLQLGVSKEQARKDLPLSQYTRKVWKCDTHNLMHFLGLRLDSHAQYEIRVYAQAVATFFRALFPILWDCLEDYRLESLTLSRLDRIVVRFMQTTPMNHADLVQAIQEGKVTGLPASWSTKRCRERDECLVKLTDLGIG